MQVDQQRKQSQNHFPLNRLIAKNRHQWRNCITDAMDHAQYLQDSWLPKECTARDIAIPMAMQEAGARRKWIDRPVQRQARTECWAVWGDAGIWWCYGQPWSRARRLYKRADCCLSWNTDEIRGSWSVVWLHIGAQQNPQACDQVRFGIVYDESKGKLHLNGHGTAKGWIAKMMCGLLAKL